MMSLVEPGPQGYPGPTFKDSEMNIGACQQVRHSWVPVGRDIMKSQEGCSDGRCFSRFIETRGFFFKEYLVAT